MKRLHTGVIILDGLDILCLSFSAGSLIAYGFKRYRNYRRIKITGEDLIVNELKRKFPRMMFSEKGKPLKFPLIRGGDEIRGIRGYSLILKNKKLAQIIMDIVNARKNQKKLQLLQDVLFILNGLLTTSTDLRIAVGGS